MLNPIAQVEEMHAHLKEKHQPKEFTIVVQNPLVVQAMCICDQPDCYFTATVYDVSNIWFASDRETVLYAKRAMASFPPPSPTED